MNDWLHASPSALGGKRIHRLGLSADYGIDEDGVRVALDRGVNFFLWTTRNKGMRAPLLAAMGKRRDEVAIAGFAKIGFFGWGIRSGAERLLKQLGTDYLDVYLMPWLGTGSAWTSATERELLHLRESGKVRAIGCSIHDRPRAGEIAAKGQLDLLMIRYNAAHPGAEREIFPNVKDKRPSVIAYTATAWRKLLKRPKGWDGALMSAGDCYRFQLSNPHVDLALTGPASRAELEENLTVLEKGPLTEDETRWMRELGRKAHG